MANSANKCLRSLLVLLGLLALTAAPAAAQNGVVHEVKLGALVHDMPDIWSGFRLERGGAINGEVVFNASLAAFGGHIRPVIGGTWSTAGDTSKAYAALKWEYETTAGIFFGVGIGAAVHNGILGPDEPDRKALGARYLFHFPFEVGYRIDRHHSLSVYFDHMSNGYTASYNEGLDTLGVRYGYRF